MHRTSAPIESCNPTRYIFIPARIKAEFSFISHVRLHSSLVLKFGFNISGLYVYTVFIRLIPLSRIIPPARDRLKI